MIAGGERRKVVGPCRQPRRARLRRRRRRRRRRCRRLRRRRCRRRRCWSTSATVAINNRGNPEERYARRDIGAHESTLT